MESANFHHQHHQLQDQLLDSSPSCYGVGSNHAWTPSDILSSSCSFILNDNNSTSNNNLVPSLNNPMIQDLGFHWTNNSTSTNPAGSFSTAHDLQLARIKEELSESYPKFTEMINSPTLSIEDLHLHPSTYIKNDHHQRYNQDLNDMSEKLLLRTFSSGCQIKGLNQFPSGEFIYSNNNQSQNGSSRGTFSQIFPTVNISSLNNQSSTAITSSSLDMNLPALDLFSSQRFSGSFSQPAFNGNLGGLFKDTCLSYGLDQMQQLSHRPTNSPSKISSFTIGGTEAKRPSQNMDTKTTQAGTPLKKSRVESRSSCPPFKVRKEKLGDRIAALQQLVAPFGKTDTSSVLMEAIGYIKFLQNQVETLSVPYLKSTQNKTSRTTQGGSMEDGNEEAKRDLRSRGLCLVPLSCLSYITDGGGGVWPSP